MIHLAELSCHDLSDHLLIQKNHKMKDPHSRSLMIQEHHIQSLLMQNSHNHQNPLQELRIHHQEQLHHHNHNLLH